LTKFQFFARIDDVVNGGSSNRVPGKFKLYGSHSGSSNSWVEIFDYTSKKMEYPWNNFTSGMVRVGASTQGYEYLGLVVGSLALENVETNFLEILEWAIYGLPFGCSQVIARARKPQTKMIMHTQTAARTVAARTVAARTVAARMLRLGLLRLGLLQLGLLQLGLLRLGVCGEDCCG
jgi:hypothetical protein